MPDTDAQAAIALSTCAALDGAEAALQALEVFAAAGDLGAARALYVQFAVIWQKHFGADLVNPAAIVTQHGFALAEPVPAIPPSAPLPRLLLARARLAAADDAEGETEALRWYHAAFLSAVQLARGQPGTGDAALMALLDQARAGMAAAAAALAPELSAELRTGVMHLGIGAAARFWTAPDDAETLAAAFIEAVAAGHSYEAGLLEPWLDTACLDSVQAAEVLFCRGIIALNARQDAQAALSLFEACAQFCATREGLHAHAARAQEHAALARARLPEATSLAT